eukprot:3967012-Alexandrium_andersonii.AAC.1
MSSRPRKGLWRGGKHQRLSRPRLDPRVGQSSSSSAPAAPLEGDPEVDLLTELWAPGLISATTLQQIGAAANSVAPRAQVAALASLGTQGTHTANIHRDL